LLTAGDRRNVVDKYRYWRHEAIVRDLDSQRHDFHVAVENWGHDFNIGSVIRTANAFNAKAFHIVGKRRWNRRGAMVTDRYQHEYHHPSVDDLISWAAAAPASGAAHGIPIIGIDNLPGSQPIETFELPRHCILLFGQEGSGLSPQAREASVAILDIAQLRFDPVDQCRCGCSDRDARVGPTARVRPGTLRLPIGLIRPVPFPATRAPLMSQRDFLHLPV